jgi:hypothetical protein
MTRSLSGFLHDVADGYSECDILDCGGAFSCGQFEVFRSRLSPRAGSGITSSRLVEI